MKTIYQSNLPIILLVLTLLVLPLIIGQSEDLTNEKLQKLADKPIEEQLTFKGFGGLELDTNGKTITGEGGSASINVKYIPEGVKIITHQDGAFIYDFNDGRKISVASGQIREELDEENKVIRYILKDDPDTNIFLNPKKNSPITINKQGQIEIKGDSEIITGRRSKDTTRIESKRIFKSTENNVGILEFEKKGKNKYFKGSNLDINTGSLKLKIGSIKTNILFNKAKQNSGQYVRVTGDLGTKNIYISGKDIEVDLLGKINKDKLKMNVNGKNVIIKTKGESGNKYNFLGKGISRQTKPSGVIIDEITIKNPNANMELVIKSDGTAIIQDGTQYVNIGGYNDVLTNPLTAKLSPESAEIPERGLKRPILKPNFFGVPQEILLFDNIYSINEDKLEPFFEYVQDNANGIVNKRKLSQSLIRYSKENNRLIKTVKFKEIPRDTFDTKFTKILETFNLPRELRFDVLSFKNNLMSKQGDNIPLNTKIIVTSNQESRPITGVMTIIQRGKIHRITIPNSYIKDYMDNLLSTQELSSDRLFELYQSHTRN